MKIMTSKTWETWLGEHYLLKAENIYLKKLIDIYEVKQFASAGITPPDLSVLVKEFEQQALVEEPFKDNVVPEAFWLTPAPYQGIKPANIKVVDVE